LQLKFSRTSTSRYLQSGVSTERSMTWKALEGGKGVSCTISTSTGGAAASSCSIEFTLPDFQLLKTQLGVAIPWLTGWMQQVNPASFGDHNIWREYVPRGAAGFAPAASSADGEDG
jgi:hypothetical protein